MEIWDLYTNDREKTGKTMRRTDPVPKGYYRIAVHVCIFNNKGKMLIQQRQPFKSGWSGLWDLSAGGSAVSGESSQEAAERELREELGIEISLDEVRPSLTVSFDGGFDDVYLVCKDIEAESLKLQYEEVKAVRWADCKEILGMIDEGLFIPYHKDLIKLLFSLKNKEGMHQNDVKSTQNKAPEQKNT